MTVENFDPATVGSLLEARAESRGDHPFLICDEDTLTYADAAERSAALARGLIGAGLARGSRVGLLYPNGSGFAVAALAAARIGAVAVPLSTFSTAGELATLLRNGGVEMLITCARYRRHDFVQTLGAVAPELDLDAEPPLHSPSVPSLRQIVFDAPGSEVRPEWTLQSLLDAGTRIDPTVFQASQEQVRPADRLVIVHTSGSTADPKGVIHTHGSLLGHQRVLNRVRRLDEADALFCNSPFFWIGGYAYALMGTLEAGATLVCSNAEDASRVLDVIERTRPTLVNGFAQAVAHLPQDPSFPGRDLSSIRRGNLYPIMDDDVRPADPELRHNMLGMTETGSVCLASDDESDQPEVRRGSFGRPVPGLEAKIVDPDSGREVAAGETGELCLRGPALMEGYCGRERHETFDRDGWYRTGDLFHTDGDLFYHFHGRSGDMIKTSGANVSPREVEGALLEETGLTAHVFGIEDAASGQIVTAVLRVPTGSVPPSPDELATTLRGRLSAYKVPKRILLIDEAEVPIMSSGKIDMRALKERARDR